MTCFLSACFHGFFFTWLAKALVSAPLFSFLSFFLSSSSPPHLLFPLILKEDNGDVIIFFLVIALVKNKI
jgi:hypothetical protein